MNADRNISLFNRGIRLSGLENKLNEIGPYTILGPVNLALGRLASLTYEQLLEPANMNKLVAFLSGYILVGKKMISDFRNNQNLATLDGKSVTVIAKDNEVHINGAKILARDRQGSNGVIHLLDSTYSIPELPAVGLVGK
jgi:uncharacterized surface protein with fasciclin (FAS1) repeats